MELQIKEYKLPEEIQFNFEELRDELQLRTEEYKTVVYTAENIREARSDRAKLNALKKSLNDERIRLEREFMAPFQQFKAQVTDLVMIVDEAVSAVDKQVKDYEELQKKDKQAAVEALFQAVVAPDIPWLGINQIWNEKWLNATYKTGQIEKDFAEIVARIKSDMEMLGRLPEYSFEAQEMYKQTLNVNDALWQADHLKQMAEAKKAAEAAASQTTADEELPGQVTMEEFMPEPVEPNMAESEAPVSVLQFRCYCTMEQAMQLRHFMVSSGIKFERI